MFENHSALLGHKIMHTCYPKAALQRFLGLLCLATLASCSQFLPYRESGYERPPAHTTVASNAAYSRVVDHVIENARTYTGTPYQHGGTTRKGMDCSGLVYVCFKKEGLEFPRSTIDQASKGRKIDLRSVRPGDLLFFHTDKNDPFRISHVGIVTQRGAFDNITFIHAASKGVREDNLTTDYYRRTFAKAVRPF